ncbi:hydantoinase/oxoprolinase N-terminal domain-containing protein [Sediminivirga luteola]|uniref:Hydantoinase n=1 Tax=Sediminivirga luteola TaxID=1774748 RepID=A0A8J2XJQ9_9MICO|nr:hydantoinase/oxoprolinase family protein [Sediminivirga luteola]GGA21748.1 hydantoinase [Sediminivirga luteola]
MRIGIDVGGTNTDSVLMEGDTVLAGTKAPTTDDISTGIVNSLDGLKAERDFDPGDIEAVMIGTTHFVNAFVEARRLVKVAALRLGLPATASLPPMVDWPQRLVEATGGRSYLAHGGHEFDGREISPLDPDEIKRIAADMRTNGVEAVAVSSVFSPVNDEFEVRAAEILAEELGPAVSISLSSRIGRTGLLGRENAAIANAALSAMAQTVVGGFERSLADYGITAPLFLSQNDGTLMGADYARQYPISTFSSGPTNSMRGAAVLSGLEDCAVVDVGGTTSDIGILVNKFPREANTEVEIGGVRTNFRMPDVYSIGIGGGSLVSAEAAVGPRSVGYRLTTEALVFGGATLTASDIAVAAGMAEMGDPSRVAHLDKDFVTAAVQRIADDVAEGVDRMRTSSDPLPVVAVGGGSILLPDRLPGLGEMVRPDNFAVANAIGAAIAQIGGEIDQVFTVAPGTRDDVVAEAREAAVDRAVEAGADRDTVRIVDFDEVPLPYLPGNATRIRCKAVGDLKGV